jgi:phage N-6-adenine-methyltransferase
MSDRFVVGEQTQADPDALQPHPKNRDLYTNRENHDLAERIEQHGFDDHQRLVVCPDKTILSGHRRWDVALSLEMDTVPVEVVDVDPDSDEALRILLASNDYREKAPAEKVNEAEMWLEIEKEEGKRRMAEGSENSKNHDSWEEAAEKAGFSGNSFSKGKKVKEKAEEGDPDAQREWDKLETGDQSIHGAYTTVTKEDDSESEDESDIDQFTSQQTDEWSSPREIVEPLADVLDGFDLDPCSGAEQSPFADETYTESDDGLEQSWFGTVWVNPPYSDVADWTAKAGTEYNREDVESIYYLCKGDSSTEWWQRAATDATMVVTIDHRLSFGDGENSAPFPSHIFVYDRPSQTVLDTLSEYGSILTTLRTGGNDDE